MLNKTNLKAFSARSQAKNPLTRLTNNLKIEQKSAWTQKKRRNQIQLDFLMYHHHLRSRTSMITFKNHQMTLAAQNQLDFLIQTKETNQTRNLMTILDKK